MKGALNGVEIKRIDSENEGVLLDMDTQQGYETVLRFINNGYRFPTAIQAAAGKRLILVRHGRIVQHAGKIFLGQYDAPLSELGRMDAVHAAEETARIAPRTNVIYTSPLSRASDTARIIAGKINAGVAVREGLEEISLGSWDGRLIEEVAARFPQAYMQRRENPLTFAPPGGESMIHLRIRILQEIRDICGNDAGGDIVLVTHAGVINTIKCLLGHGDFDNIFDMEKVGYGSVTVLEVDDEDCKA